MRLLVAVAALSVVVYAQVPVPQILTVEQARQLEATVAKDPGDAGAQKLLGQNYALFILGGVSISPTGLVDQIDPAKAASEFAVHARQALTESPLPVVVGEGALALWSYRSPAYPAILKISLQQRTDAGQLASELLNRAIALKPDQPEWHLRRITMTAQEVNFGQMKADEGYALAARDLAALSGDQRYLALASVAKLAAKTEQTDAADALSRELLKSAAGSAQTWNAGNAIHTGNMVLGQTALQRGDLRTAGEYLLASARTTGSPQLNSFGPNMSLALALLNAGQKNVVLQYFDLCRGFWKMGNEKLTRWSTEVGAGLTPEFGGNLAY